MSKEYFQNLTGEQKKYDLRILSGQLQEQENLLFNFLHTSSHSFFCTPAWEENGKTEKFKVCVWR